MSIRTEWSLRDSMLQQVAPDRTIDVDSLMLSDIVLLQQCPWYSINATGTILNYIVTIKRDDDLHRCEYDCDCELCLMC